MGSPATVEEGALDPLVRWLEREGERTLADIAEVVMGAAPELGSDEAGGPEQLASALAEHAAPLRAVMDGSLRGRDAKLPDAITALLEQLARRGVSLPGVLRSFEVGHAVLWRRFAEALKDERDALDPAERAEMLEVASIRLFEYIQSDTSQVATMFAREHARRERRLASRRHETVAALLEGAIAEHDAEDALGIRLSAAHVGYVAWVADPAEVDRLDAVVARLRTAAASSQHVAVPAGGDAVHGWFASTGPAWRTAVRALELPEGAGLAVGAAHPGPDGFRATHRDALDARRVGEIVAPARPVLYEDVSVAALSSRDSDAARAFVERELGPLVGDERLLGTLGTYLAQLGSPTHAARALGVHPNTVIKRLERAEELLERRIDPASLPLRLAVELAPLVRATSGG